MVCCDGPRVDDLAGNSPDARQARRGHPAGAVLRAEVGRVPGDRGARRLGHRDPQPQRQADGALLPGSGRRVARAAAGALHGRRRDRGDRAVAGGWTSSRCSSASTRRRAGSSGWRGRRRRASWRSICSTICALPFRSAARGAGGDDAGRRRCTSRRSRATSAVAREWFDRFEGAGLDGVIAKDGSLPYRPGQRVMFKVKHQRTADCVIAGYRLHKSEPERDRVAAARALRGRGAVADRRRRLVPARVPARAAGDAAAVRDRRRRRIRGASGCRSSRAAGTRPASSRSCRLRPVRVIEVRYDHMDGRFLRHPATFLRWRDDRDPESCTFDQLVEAEAVDVRAALRAGP